MTLSTTFVAATTEPAFAFGAAYVRPNEVMLSTLLRRGKRGNEIARMYGLPPAAIAQMREAIGI